MEAGRALMYERTCLMKQGAAGVHDHTLGLGHEAGVQAAQRMADVAVVVC